VKLFFLKVNECKNSPRNDLDDVLSLYYVKINENTELRNENYSKSQGYVIFNDLYQVN